MPEKITLYGYTTSPFVRKVSCYLYYKGLPFDFVGVSPFKPEKTIGFTGGSQVPVLKIEDEWRLDSSKIGLWLDEIFPEKPLVFGTTDERDKIAEIDAWASDQFIPGMFFRWAIDGKLDAAFCKCAWRLADIVSDGATLPYLVKKAWPFLIRRAPFIVHMVNQLDRTEPLEAMQLRLFMELVQHLGEGPYLGGLPKPSLADFAIYPQIMFYYQVGLVESLPILEHPTVGPWLKRMDGHLPRNPWCVSEEFISNPMPFD